MEIKVNKEVLIKISDLLVEVNLLAKKALQHSLILNEKSIDFVEQPSGELTLYTQKNEKDVLEIAYQLEKVTDLFEKQLI